MLRNTRAIPIGAATETSMFSHRRQPSKNRRRTKVRGGPRFSFLGSCFRLLVPKTVCGFSGFECVMPPGIPGDMSDCLTTSYAFFMDVLAT